MARIRPLYKKQPFKLLYIDAFAGTGEVELRNEDPDQEDRRAFIDGSAKIALDIEDKSFDELIFIEKDEVKCSELRRLKTQRSDRNIVIEPTDANISLQNLRKNWREWRGVLFLDPFGTQVDWSTLEAIAGYKLDTWILFPTGTIARMLPRSRIPDDISLEWARTLTRVYGDERWRNLYKWSPKDLFGESRLERQPGVNGLRKIYKERLKELFGRRFLDQSRTLKNTRNSPMYEFMFCVGDDSQAAIGAAKRIAKHLVDRL